MKFIATLTKLKNYLSVIALLTLTLSGLQSYGQTKNYATVTPSTGAIAYYNLLGIATQQNTASAGSVTNPGNAAVAPPGSPATLSANYFNLLGLANAEGEAYIELKYAAPLAAGKTTYIRFDQPTTTGISLDLLSTVGGLTGLLSNNLVEIDAYTGAGSGTDGTMISNSNVTNAVVRDAAGINYLAVTSTVGYNAVRVRLRYKSNLLGLGLGSTLNMNVYTAFNTNADNCGTAIFTDLGVGSGVNVSLTTLVTNPERAIDGNLTTYSQIQSGLVGLGTTVSQTIYLNGLSGAGDVAKVYLSQPGTVLTANVLQTVTLQAYNGSTPVGGVQNAGNLINLQLLSSFTNNTPIPVFFTPGAPFDRIQIAVNNTLAVGGNILVGGLNINEVQRTVTAPTFAGKTNGAITICGGSTLTLSALSSNPAYTYNFYKKTNNVTTKVAAATASTYTETGLASGTYTYYISAQKSGCTGESDVDSVSVVVKPVLVFATTALNNGSVGKAYAKQINVATGGTPTYTYALAAGNTLPSGLAITPAGLISGTPSTAGTYNFNLTATDSFGCIQAASYTLIITPTLVMPTAVLPVGTVGTAYPSTQLPSPTGGSTPYTYTAANLPAGLSLNASTGVITGTPTVSGTFTFPVTVTDADGNMVSTNFTILVRDPLALPAATLSSGTTGTVYPTQIIPSATGGSGVYTYTATSLPPGLTFNPVTREITGTPTQSGTFTFPVNVSDSEGRTASSNYTIVIKDPLLLAGATLPNGTVGVNYPVQTLPAATGGTGPYTYVAANVPPGLTFDPVTRQISGTPTQSGTFTISETVTDSNGASTTVPYTLTVNGTLALAQATLPNGTVGTAYTSTALPSVTGGTAPYTYTMANLPAGLSFNPATRVISGTPSVGGSFTVTMTATDSNGLSTSTDYMLNVNVSDPSVDAVTICGGNSATLNISNPVTGVTYNFYSATGNTPLSNGTSYNTGVLTQTTTFYVQAASGTAVSNRVAVTVTVNPSPAAPTVTTNGATISSGQTATLQATADAGSTIEWYAAATGGTALASGGTFTTPALTASTTYYAGTINSSGCSSLTRVPVLVNVLAVTTNPNCNAAATQQSGITGLLCVACSIQNPGNSVDADATNFTQINVTAGVGAAGYQTLIFQRSGLATDSIRLNLGTPTGLANVGALGGITINVMNGNTIVKTYVLNNSLVTLNLLPGGSTFNATFLAGAPYDRVQVSLNPVASVLSSVNIYGAQIILPNPALASGDQTICSGSSVTLSAAAMGGSTLTWYNAPTGGIVLATGGTYTTPALTATTIYYIGVSSNGCANPTRVPDTVTVTPVVAVPVLATVAPLCSGSSERLSVSNPQAGITYKWYATATGGTALATDSVFTTPALTANTTYYLEASVGNCTAANRVAANIVVNPRPVLPTISASATTVNQGQTVTLTGSSTDANVVFNWYTSVDATTPVFTGPTYVTPPITATTTFYMDATSTVTGCASPMRVQQTITVTGNGIPVPVPCELPVSQTNGVAGTLSILARVDNPTLAIDGDQQTGSTLSIPVGLNATVFQKVNFTGLSNVGDTVRVLLTSPGQTLSLSVLSGVTLTTYQGAASNNDAATINNSLINVQLLSGGTQALINLVPAAQFDGIAVTLNSGLVGALSSIDFNYAQRIAKAPVVTPDTVSACLNATATLTVTNPQPGIVYKWYNAAGNYLGNDGASFVTPPITANTQFFVAATRNGCGGSRTAVTVLLVPAPQVPALLGATEQTCQNANLVLQVQNPQTGVTYQWYNGSTAIAGAITSSLSVTNIQTSAVYSVEAINSCGTVSARASVTITVGSLTAPVVTPAAVTVNSGEQTVLTASSSTSNLTYTWYSDAALTNVVSNPTNGANGTFITPNLTATTTYYVTAQSTMVGGCLSPAASAVVTVNAIPPNPGSVPCEPAISQSARTGGTVTIASVANPGYAVDDDINTSSSLFIPVGVNGFVAQKVNFNGLSQVGDTVKLSISSPAALLSLTAGSSITVTTYNGATSNGDERAISSPGINLQLLSGGTNAIIEFVPGQTFDGVELKLNSGTAGLLTGVNLNYAQRILLAPSVAAASVNVCAGSSATLAVTNPATGITYKWYRDATLLVTSSTYQTPATLTAGTYNYYVSANRNGCESAKTAVTVTVAPDAPAPVPSGGNPVSTCLNTPVTLSVVQVPNVTYNWYDAATGGNLLASNTNTLTTPASLGVGTTNFFVEAVNSNSCTSPALRTEISIVIKPAATSGDLSVSGAGAPFCAGSNVSLTASSTTVTNPVFTWYSDAALSNPVFTGPTFNITAIAASTTYYVTVRGDNECENTAGNALPVNVQVNPSSVAADITVSGIPAGICAGTPVTLTASTTTVTNPVFTWYTDAALTNAVFTGPTYTVTPAAGNTNYYVTVQGTNKCPNTAANAKVVALNVNPPAMASDISVNGVPATICSGSGAALTASSSTVTNPVFTWYTDAALSNAVFTGAVYNTPAITANTTYYVTVHGDNKCENTAGNAYAVVLNLNPAMSFTGTALSDGTVSTAYTAQLSAATGGTPGYTYVIASGNTLPAGLTLSSGGLISGTPAIAGNYIFAVTATDSKGCNATATFTLNIVNTGGFSLPPANLPVGSVGTLYPVQTLPSAIGGTAPYTYVATGVPAGFTYDPLTKQISGTPTAGGTFTFSVTATDANGLTATTNYVIMVTVPAPAVADATICSGTTATLAVSNPVTGVTYNWYATAIGGNSLFTGTSFQTPAATSNTTYYAEGASGTAFSTRTPANVILRPNATAADITITGVPATICSGSGVTLTASSTTVTSPVFTWYSDVALTNAVFTGAVFNIPSLSSNLTYYVTVRGDNKCESLSGNANVVALNVNPAITFSGAALGNGTVSNVYSATLNAATGGTPGYTYTLASGSVLPGGLTLSTSGVISGTPATAGNYTFSITVTDSRGCNATAVFTLTINNAPAIPAPVVAGATTCSATPVTLTVSNPVTGVTYNWYDAAIGGNLLFTGNNFQTPAITATTTYYAEGTAAGMTTSTRTAATVTVKPNATAADITVTGAPAIVCSGSGVTLTASSTTVTNPIFTWYTDAALTNAVFTGAVYTIPSLTASTNYYVSVSGDNKCANASGTGYAVALAVNPAMSFTGAALSNATLSAAYSAQLNAAAGGTPGYTYTLASGSVLPAGLTLSTTGLISGTPTIAGNYTFAVTVTDSKGCNVTANFSLTVDSSTNIPAPVVTGVTTCSGTPATLTVSNPVTGITYNWYDAATGGNLLFTGNSFQTPAITATTSYYIEGTNGATTSTRTPVTVTVKPNATAADITVTGAPATICSGSGVTLTASSTTVTNPVFTWYTDAALTNAVFTGAVYTIPSLTASTNYYVSVSGDNKCANASGTGYVIALAVNPAISFSTTTLSNGTIATAYSAQLNAPTGGSPGYTYTLASGSVLPADLSLSANGLISGTPAVTGNYTFSVIVADSKGCNATATFSLSIGGVAPAGLNLPPAVLPDGIVGSVYTPQTLPSAIGGTGPYTYVATGLPPGLTFDPSTRQITGTPTLGGTYTLTVTVTDASGLTATATYTINVTVPSPAVANSASCSGSEGMLTVTNPVAGVDYNWYASPSGGSILFTGTTYQTPVINGTTAYYVEGASGTAVSSRTSASVVVSPVLATPVVTSTASTFTSVTFSWNNVPGAISYEVSTDGGSTWQTPTSGATGTTDLVSGLQTNEKVTLLVRAKGATTCQTSSPGSFTGTANNNNAPSGNAIYIPNTFTPNGDGNNDIFYAFGNTIANVKMRIYDQWGHLVFQSDTNQIGWDGTYRGTMEPNGVYVYVIDLKMTDGTSTMKKGTITLLR